MSISRLETFAVAPRWLFVRIETDDGVVGWGEATLEGHLPSVRAAVEQFSEYLIGADPSTIEAHWAVLTKGGFYRGGPVLASAVAGIDQALWDIAGKSLGVPVSTLLGGAVRDSARVYAWVGGDDPGEIADAIHARMASGLTAVKMNASGKVSPNASLAELDEVVARIAVAREVLGRSGDVAIDLHGRMSLATARRLAPLIAEYHPFFMEEPVVPELSHLLPDLVRSTTVPIATGERLYSKEQFLPVLAGGVAIVQPDIAHAGGITEAKKIASLADTFGASVAPHSPIGPIALAACLQLDFSIGNFLIQEHSIGIHYNAGADVLDYIRDPLPFDHSTGSIKLLTGPGLGIHIDEDAVRGADAAFTGWQTPLWRHRDGSFAEW